MPRQTHTPLNQMRKVAVDRQGRSIVYPNMVQIGSPAAPAANPWAEIPVVVSKDGTTHTIYHGQRSGLVTRWESQFPAQGNVSWMARLDIGRSLAMSDFFFE